MTKNEIRIIEDNENYLIIDKPAGLIVHGGNSIKEPTLTDWLVEKYPQLKNVGEDPVRPAIVHRLDKEASGLMIIPKNNSAFEYYKEQFKSRKMEKEYLAMVFGSLDKDQDTIDFPIKRSSQGHKMACIPKTNKNIDGQEDLDEEKISNRALGNVRALEKSRQAITEYSIIKRLINYTLIKVKIKTGRTHQIRVHFSAYGHPLVGDKLYGNKKTRIKNSKINLNRIFLMSSRLGFIDQSGEKKEFSIDLSPDLQEALEKLK